VPVLHEYHSFTYINISPRKLHPRNPGNGELFIWHPCAFLCGYRPSSNVWIVSQHERMQGQAKAFIVILHTDRLYLATVWNPGEPGSSVSMSCYGLDDRAIEVRSLAAAKNFSSSLCVQTGSGAHPASCTMGTGVLSSGVKTGRGVTLTTHPNLVSRSRRSRSYTSSPLKCLCRVKWDSFRFCKVRSQSVGFCWSVWQKAGFSAVKIFSHLGIIYSIKKFLNIVLLMRFAKTVLQ
jgi:hypothetical protein